MATYLAGKLIHLLRDIVLLMLAAGFAAMLLNPAVAKCSGGSRAVASP